MLERNRLQALLIAGTVGALLVAALWALAPNAKEASSDAAPSSSPQLMGVELAHSLGLQEVEGWARGVPVDITWCHTGVAEAAPTEQAFCLDNAIDPSQTDWKAEAWRLARELAGHEVTDAQMSQRAQNLANAKALDEDG